MFPTIALIALDLDGTLLDEGSRLTPLGRDALGRAIARGVEIVVATGRAFVTIPVEIAAFPGIRYAITGNGAAIYDLTTRRPIFRQTLSPGTGPAVLEMLKGLNVNYEVFVDGAAYAQRDYLARLGDYMMDDAKQRYVLETRRPVADIADFIRQKDGALDSLAVIPRTMPIKREATARLIKLPEVYVTTSDRRMIEINHQSCTKAAGLAYLARRLHIPQSQTAAFGNGDNDAEMLAWAGVGISVADGTALCRAAADHVAGPYQEDGVARAFAQYLGI